VTQTNGTLTHVIPQQFVSAFQSGQTLILHVVQTLYDRNVLDGDFGPRVLIDRLEMTIVLDVEYIPYISKTIDVLHLQQRRDYCRPFLAYDSRNSSLDIIYDALFSKRDIFEVIVNGIVRLAFSL
jgi:hypothetical protein